MESDFVKASEKLRELLDADTLLHSSRVSTITAILLNSWLELYREKDINKENIDKIKQAAYLHDIGKTVVSKEVLFKPEKLSEEEFEIMKTHTVKGCEIIKSFQFSDEQFYKYCYNICRSHHERWDGKGYPDGLSKNEIPIWVEVVAFADCFDALVFPRKYKNAISCKKASDMILQGSCGAFSEDILNCFSHAKEEIFKFAEYEGVRCDIDVC